MRRAGRSRARSLRWRNAGRGPSCDPAPVSSPSPGSGSMERKLTLALAGLVVVKWTAYLVLSGGVL
jgi:hypothetical protein